MQADVKTSSLLDLRKFARACLLGSQRKEQRQKSWTQQLLMLYLVAKSQQVCISSNCVIHVSSQANAFTGLEQMQHIQSDTSYPAVNVAAHVEAHDAARQLLGLPNCSDHKSSSHM